MCDYQESVTTGQTKGQTDAGQSDPYVPPCFAGNTKITSIARARLKGIIIQIQKCTFRVVLFKTNNSKYTDNSKRKTHNDITNVYIY